MNTNLEFHVSWGYDKVAVFGHQLEAYSFVRTALLSTDNVKEMTIRVVKVEEKITFLNTEESGENDENDENE